MLALLPALPVLIIVLAAVLLGFLLLAVFASARPRRLVSQRNICGERSAHCDCQGARGCLIQ
jgi:hypothetical protein